MTFMKLIDYFKHQSMRLLKNKFKKTLGPQQIEDNNVNYIITKIKEN